MYTSVIFSLVLASCANGQWNFAAPGANFNPMLAGSQVQPAGGLYGSSLTSQPGSDQLAAQFAPQFAQFGTQYQGYAGQNSALDRYQGQMMPNLPIDTLRLYAAAQSPYGLQQTGFANQPRPFQQLTHQPGAFGPHSAIQGGPIGPLGYSRGLQTTGYDQYQADDFMGTIEKPASTPPTSGPVRVIPPFMKGQSVEDQDKFYAIVQHPTWSSAEKNAKIEELVQNMSADAQNTFAQYQRATSSDLSAKRQRVHEAVAAMSPEAQQQFQKVSALMTNPRIPEQERLQKIQDLYSKLPDSVRQEFDAKFTNL
ncbi:DUF148 domain-containing protein [Trichostrongylus colubriformis]|uniref:DUF148 domain-containing protein n=1 Tax=Trichostrongylus colubriformis TaxID=6319 RepID=A0AAN8II66_TRICO